MPQIQPASHILDKANGAFKGEGGGGGGNPGPVPTPVVTGGGGPGPQPQPMTTGGGNPLTTGGNGQGGTTTSNYVWWIVGIVGVLALGTIAYLAMKPRRLAPEIGEVVYRKPRRRRRRRARR